MTRFSICGVLVIAASTLATAQPAPKAAGVDVLNYRAVIEPSIESKSVRGTVKIRFKVGSGTSTELALDCGGLTIDSVTESKAALSVNRLEKRLIITLPDPVRPGAVREIEVRYHGTPAYGIRFYPEERQVYTVFSTSQWMVCVDAPEDKATFDLNLILPMDYIAVGNGRLCLAEHHREWKGASSMDAGEACIDVYLWIRGGPFSRG